MQDEYTGNRAGERLRSSIEGRGWTMAAFSRICGVPYRSIQDYVAGKSRPGFEQLAKFAESGLDVTYILTGKSLSSSENNLPDCIKIGGFSIGRHPYIPAEGRGISDKVEGGFQLRDWIDIWTLADDNVPPSEEFGFDSVRRQGAVAFVACGITFDLIERMRVLGWLPR